VRFSCASRAARRTLRLEPTHPRAESADNHLPTRPRLGHPLATGRRLPVVRNFRSVRLLQYEHLTLRLSQRARVANPR
jgi:hypothetical protein